MAHDSNHYKATYITGSIATNGKQKFVIVTKSISRFRKDKIEVKVMHQSDYKKSDKSNQLLVFAVNGAYKNILEKLIKSKIGKFDEENPNNFPGILNGFECEEVMDGFASILNEEIILSPLTQGEELQREILDKILLWQSDFEIKKDKYLGNFDVDSINKELNEIIGAFITIFKEKRGELSEINALIDRANAVKYQISLLDIDITIMNLRVLRSRMAINAPEQSKIQKLIDDILVNVELHSNEKDISKKIKIVNDILERAGEQRDSYAGALGERIALLRDKLNVISNQLSKLVSLVGFSQASGDELNKAELDVKIEVFSRDLNTKPLNLLEKDAGEIEALFTARSQQVRESFIKEAKKVIAERHDELVNYLDKDEARYLKEEASSLYEKFKYLLTTEDLDTYLSKKQRLDSFINRVDRFCSKMVDKEGDAITNYRKGSSTITRFFAEKTDVLNSMKDHAEKIQNGYWGADKKANMLREILTKADEIKDQHQNLIRTPVLDQSKAQNMRESINALFNFIDKNKVTLYHYRGVSALKPLAKLWGGGKVTTEEYINQIKQGINDCDKSASVLQLATIGRQ